MHGTKWKGIVVLTLGIGLMGCADAEEIDERSSAYSVAPVDPNWGDDGIGPLTPALWEDEEMYQPPDGRIRPPRCRVVLHYCNRPGPDDRGECEMFNCDFLRGYEACTTLAWQVCGTFVPPYVY